LQDKAALDEFTDRYDQMHCWGKLTHGLVLDIGAENYPFLFTLLKNDSARWYLGTSSAKEEILACRIGGNELATVEGLHSMADAQARYFSQTHDGSHVRQCVQNFMRDNGR